MTKREIKRNIAVFPMSSVMALTELSARQIRYYESQGLVFPERNSGNNRLFSLNDIDLLLDIKEMLDESYTIKEIKATFAVKKEDTLTEEKIRIALYQDLMQQSRLRDNQHLR